MQIFKSLSEWKARRTHLTGKLGFIPTMGALHAGHLSLVQKSLSENDHTLVSIFVNPTQFNQKSDLDHYPRTWESDVELLQKVGTPFLLSPDDLYPDAYRYQVRETSVSTRLCGAHRPGHFDGVLTVVLKLLQIAQAHRAYFGEKDYQQLELVKGMADAFFLPTEIVGLPTARDSDGLALSSRNLRLTAEQRALAPKLYEHLCSTQSEAEIIESLTQLGFKVDYIERWGNRRLGAAFLGEVRLIDNVKI